MIAFSIPPENAGPRDLRRTAAGFGLGALIVFVLVGALHRFIAPFATGAISTGATLAPPSAAHPFGTDILGRDLWSESLHGLGVTLGEAAIGFVVALFVGSLAGLVVAHGLGRGGRAVRIGANVLVSIPALLLAILFSALLGPENIAIAAGLAAAPAAFVRSYDRARAVLSAPYSDFARASGVSRFAMMRRDLTYEAREHLIATAARLLAAVTITLSTMSFFGFGSRPPDRDLGLMIASARAALPAGWWTALAPAVMLTVFILAARLAAGLAGGERP